MEVKFAFLCDYADNSATKLTAVGIGFDTIYAASVPAIHRSLYAVISIQFSSVEIGTKQVGLRVVDADGHGIVPDLDQPLHVASPPEGYTYRTMRVILGIGGLKFDAFGDHAVVWLVNGQEAARVSLKVVEPPATPTTS